MPHFYFHVFNGSGETRDEEGVDLPDLAAAVARATSGIRSILCDELSRGLLDLGGMIRVTDEQGRMLIEVPFDTAVELRPANRYV